MTKDSNDRLQINCRLSPEHSKKLLDLTKFSTAGSVVIIGQDFSVPVGQVEVAPTTLAGALLGYAIDHFHDKYVEPSAAAQVRQPLPDEWNDPGALPLSQPQIDPGYSY